MSTTAATSSVPEIAQEATAMAHAAIQASLAEDEQRQAECVHAMLAHPIRAALCMWSLVHACQAMAAALASSMNTDPAEAWRVAKAIAEDAPAGHRGAGAGHDLGVCSARTC